MNSEKIKMPAPDPALLAKVAGLKKSGEHAAAAAVLFGAGLAKEAGELYEQIFEYKSALLAFESVDDIFGAMRAALALDDSEAVERVITRAIKEDQALALIDLLSRQERHVEIGHIYAALDDYESAAQAYQRGEQPYKAGAAYEKAGDFRNAGLAYEAHLERDPGDALGALRLGTILSRFSRHDDAISLLQMAIRQASHPHRMRCKASPSLILSFEALGYHTAAQSILEAWQKSARTIEYDVPESMESFLSSGRATVFSAQQKKEPQAETTPVNASAGGGLDDFFGEGPSDGLESASAPEEQIKEEDVSSSAYLLAGRYLLGEPLSGGGVGQVFRAYDSFTDDHVAVKIFGAEAMSSDAVKTYAQEARAASSLGHPSIAKVVELNAPEGFMVTRYTEGQSLEKRMQRGGESAWLLPFAHALLDVLGATHRVGLVHGALKPSNLFLREGGLKVLDFGANHLLSLRSTETGGLASVWPYLSPEQLFGQKTTARSDLYAVAAILYRALCATPPFSKAATDRKRKPLPPSAHGDALAPFDDVLLKALDPEPSKRFASASEMRAALPKAFDLELMPAGALTQKVEKEAPKDIRQRYERGALVFRDGTRARVYEGSDRVVERPVWLVETDTDEALDAMRACAEISLGAQPVYDVLPEETRAVVARDEDAQVPSFDELRAIPQGLARDLRAVARALEQLHQNGFAFHGFQKEHALGPAGPRLRLAPARLPKAITDEGRAADWESFARLVLFAFDGEFTGHLREDVVGALGRSRLLDPSAQLALKERLEDALTWPDILEVIASQLVSGHGARVIARVASQVLR